MNPVPMNLDYAKMLQDKTQTDPQGISDLELQQLYHMIRPSQPEPEPEVDPNQDLIDYQNTMSKPLPLMLKDIIRK